MQKPSICLSALTFCVLAFCLSTCSVNPNLQGKGEAYLQGEWRQDNALLNKHLIDYSLYDLKFSCDSFYIKVSSFSKINTGADSCMRQGHWAEYIKGNYAQSHDTLYLKGQFCNADYSLKNEGGCFRSGVYKEIFTVGKKTDSLIQFSSTSNIIPINARLIKKLTCKPQPL